MSQIYTRKQQGNIPTKYQKLKQNFAVDLMG